MSVIYFPPVNQCIYCDKTVGNFSKEHIIALSMGGGFILPNASCEVCANITMAIEANFTRLTLGEVRAAHEMPTRRKKDRLKYTTVTISFGKFGPTKDVEVLIAEAPIYFVIPSYILEKYDGPDIISTCSLAFNSEQTVEQAIKTQRLLAKFKAVSVTSQSPSIKAGNFERILWKIVTGIGWHNFPNALKASSARDYVLGNTPCYIAGDSQEKLMFKNILSIPRTKQSYSDARISISSRPEENHRYIYVEIDFFANLGFPVYCCILPNISLEVMERKIFRL